MIFIQRYEKAGDVFFKHEFLEIQNRSNQKEMKGMKKKQIPAWLSSFSRKNIINILFQKNNVVLL